MVHMGTTKGKVPAGIFKIHGTEEVTCRIRFTREQRAEKKWICSGTSAGQRERSRREIRTAVQGGWSIFTEILRKTREPAPCRRSWGQTITPWPTARAYSKTLLFTPVPSVVFVVGGRCKQSEVETTDDWRATFYLLSRARPTESRDARRGVMETGSARNRRATASTRSPRAFYPESRTPPDDERFPGNKTPTAGARRYVRGNARSRNGPKNEAPSRPIPAPDQDGRRTVSV